MEVNIVHARSGKILAKLVDLSPSYTILDVKRRYQRENNEKLYPDRQSFRTDPRGKMLKDEDKLSSLGVVDGGRLYFRDLGPQLGWTTVFLCEYAGPLLVYLLFYVRPAFIYGADAAEAPMSSVAKIACVCWAGHYAKRLLETLFVHRFSHATMPYMNLFKNCSYYWGFAAFVSYFVNHPLYTLPMKGAAQIYLGLAGFIICELGNLSIHIALRNLRPPGTKERRIPMPTSNPFTRLFAAVSCPNYTYEVGAWLSFTVMTQCLPALLFTIAGFYQMAVWAQGKHRNYRSEFKNYPRSRKAIIPFLI